MAFPALHAGQLRHRITIKRPMQVSDGKGGYKTTWSTVATPRAEVLGQDGREVFAARSLQGISTYRIRIWWRADKPRQDDQILYGGETLNIRSVTDPNGDRRQLLILADTGSAQATD